MKNNQEIGEITEILSKWNEAKELIEAKKVSIIEKLQNFRNAGRLREKSEEFIKLEYAAEDNKNKIANIYNDFVEKAKNDINSLDEEFKRVSKLKSSNNLSKSDIANLDSKADLLEENAKVLDALDELLKSYAAIFGNKGEKR